MLGEVGHAKAFGIFFLLVMVQTAAAHEFFYTGNLTGPGGASGTANILLDLDLVTMDVDVTFVGISGTTTNAAIHGPTAITLTGTAPTALALTTFPTGLSSGSSSQQLDLTADATYDPAFVAASGGFTYQALNSVINGMADSKMYLQINSTAFPSGALSGFLVPVPTPEPVSLSLVGVGSFLLLGRRRIKR